MKLKYRKFDDVNYEEVECCYFQFIYDEYISEKPILRIICKDCFDNDYNYEFDNVCEVYIEEI